MAELLNYSNTERIVILIDLHPLLNLNLDRPSSSSSSSSSYLTTIISAVKRLLTFPPISSSLFSFKLFFSSLSPLKSSSAFPHLNLPTSLAFDLPSKTLQSLLKTLNYLSSGLSLFSTEFNNSSPRVEYTCNALLQLVHDYAWDLEFRLRDDGFPCIRSNLVVLFSPVTGSLNGYMSDFSEFVGLEDRFLIKFRSLFGGVNDAFVKRDIHFSWIHISCEKGDVKYNWCEEELGGYMEKGIRSFNWGSCFSDAIVLGSALVPFHLIYPIVGVSMNVKNSLEKSSAELSLEISDVNGKPLECKCCDLELLNLRASSSIRSDGILDILESRDVNEEKAESRGRGFLSCFGGDGMKLRVTSVYSCDGGNNNGSCSLEYFLVRDILGENKKTKSKSSEVFVADKILQVLSNDPSEKSWDNCVPIWQILLSFLQNRGYWAGISISNAKGDTAYAMLRPFTVHWALLSITGYDFVQDHNSSGADQSWKSTKNNNGCHNFGVVGSQTDTSISGNKEFSDGKRRSKKPPNRDLTWSSLCSAASECSHFDLAEVYFSRLLNKSKKMKFLKCWMKQIYKRSQDNFSAGQAFKSPEEQLEYTNFPEQLQKVEELLPVPSSKTSESFFSNLLCRIQDGIQSKMDLQMLAERLIKSSIYWLCQTMETGENVAERKPGRNPSCKEMVYKELRRLLLKDPKEMKDLRRHTDCSSNDRKHNPGTKNIVREYELQIFLRMEILRSEVSESIKESTKHKLLKQICSLLEILQYLIEGGIHGHIKLFDYVERTIKSRYFDVIEDAVNEIYSRMDLLPFGDDDEAQIQLLNSEDSNQSYRDRQDRYEKAEVSISHQSVSADDDSSQAPYHIDESSKETWEEEHARKLNEARERRERSRRFVYLSSRGADLHRVWAPKLQKAAKGNVETLQEKSKWSRKRVTDSVVCETPLCGTKRPFAQGSIDEDLNRIKENSCSVSRALFQDDI